MKIFSSVLLHYENCSRKYFQVFCCIMKIVLENIFMYLVTFWKCYFPPPPTQNPPPQNRITTKTPPPTPQQQQQKNQRSKARGFVCRSKSHRKSHRKSKSHKERDRFMGSWLWVEDRFVARRLWVAGEVEGLWVEGSGSKIGSWVRRSIRRSAKSKAWLAKSAKSKAWSVHRSVGS